MRWLNRIAVRVCRDCIGKHVHAYPTGELDRGIDLARAEPGDVCQSCGHLVLGSRSSRRRLTERLGR